ncbi:alpha/beta hydrolase [Chloroflexota bacterium]
MTQTEVEGRTDSDFYSHGTRCSGWLYRPGGIERPPIVIMAHGFAAEKTFRLPAYAERFVQEGIAVFIFDYRCFGDSDGQPRNLVSPRRHVQDWKAAIAHVRTLPDIDQNRIALWGTSFGGGHAIVAAAKDQHIMVVTSQVPYVDPYSSFRVHGLGDIARGWLAGLRDVIRMLTFRSPYCIPVVGDPGTLAVLNAPGAKEGYEAIVPEGSSWRNECPARIFFTGSLYRPIKVAKRVNCPTLIVMAEEDTLISPRSLERTAARMLNARLVRMPLGHFDVYSGEGFERVVEVKAAFLREHLVDSKLPSAFSP